MKQSIPVSADHIHPDWRLDSTMVEVGQHGDGLWSASLARFGYVCGFKTRDEAIRDLLLANGCTNIRIHGGAE